MQWKSYFLDEMVQRHFSLFLFNNFAKKSLHKHLSGLDWILMCGQKDWKKLATDRTNVTHIISLQDLKTCNCILYAHKLSDWKNYSEVINDLLFAKYQFCIIFSLKPKFWIWNAKKRKFVNFFRKIPVLHNISLT